MCYTCKMSEKLHFSTGQSAIEYIEQNGLDATMEGLDYTFRYWVNHPLGKTHENYFVCACWFAIAYDLYKAHGITRQVMAALDQADQVASGRGQQNAISAVIEVMKNKEPSPRSARVLAAV